MADSAPWSTEEFNGMPYRKLGKTGLKVSNVGLGTWKFGYPDTGDGSRVDEKTAFEIFDKAVELGVTFWDTANRYNNGTGNSERIIGKWFKKNPDQRRNIVLATKIFGGMDGSTPNHSGLSRGSIFDSVYACLDRLQVSYIDVLYFHAFDSEVSIKESLSAVKDLVKMDMVRYFAVSNFTKEQIDMYVDEDDSARCRICAVQNQYDILNGEGNSISDVLDYAKEKEISYIAWSPLARGLLTDRYVDPKKVGKGDRLFDEGEEGYKKEELHEKVVKLADIAHGLKLELNQLALAYMLTIPGMGPVIPASSSVKQVESNAEAGKVELSNDTKKEIEKIIGV